MLSGFFSVSGFLKFCPARTKLPTLRVFSTTRRLSGFSQPRITLLPLRPLGPKVFGSMPTYAPEWVVDVPKWVILAAAVSSLLILSVAMMWGVLAGADQPAQARASSSQQGPIQASGTSPSWTQQKSRAISLFNIFRQSTPSRTETYQAPFPDLDEATVTKKSLYEDFAAWLANVRPPPPAIHSHCGVCQD